MNIGIKAWKKYIARLKAINDTAAQEMAKVLEYVNFEAIPEHQRREIINYAYRLTKKYGEAAGALACEMYDALSELSGKYYPPAVPAATSTYQEVAKAVNGTLKYQNPTMVEQAVSRMVKLAGADTVLQNAIRDKAERAWISMGETCPFCMMLSSQGWLTANKEDLRNGHARHVHANCDCMYTVRFDKESGLTGYDPKYFEALYKATGETNAKDKLNAMRRTFYKEHKEKIKAQKEAAYERAKALTEE